MRLRFALAAVALWMVTLSAHATTLTFEDVTGSLSTYQGFTWNNAIVIVASDFSKMQGIPQSVVSGSHVVVNPDFGTNSFSSSTLFHWTAGTSHPSTVPEFHLPCPLMQTEF
jgi:hypothetical protein